MDGQMFIGNKKKNPIDTDIGGNKNSQKYHKKKMNKSMAVTKIMNEIQQKKKQSQKSKETNSNNNKILDPKIKKKVDDIKSILQNHKIQVILQVLERHNYNQQQALQQLFTIPADQPQQKFQQQQPNKPPDLKKTKKKKQQQYKQSIGNDLLNQIYDNNEQIDPSQFEQLFAQIANIIKQQQKNKGMPLFQINQFIDDCFSIKSFILQNQNQIYIDENDQLCQQTQLFLEEIIKNRVALQVKRQSDFPTLGSVNGKKSNEKGLVQKIHDSYKQQKRKQQYFEPSKVPQVNNHYHNEHEYSLYSVNSSANSYRDILQLSKQYNDMGIDKLKWIYLRLEDINLCKTFLDKYYSNKKRQIKVEKIQENKKVNQSTPKKSLPQKPSYKRLEDENFKNYSLRQIRDELDHLFKLKSLFKITRGKTTNIAHRKQLQRIAHRDDPRIQKLCQVARFKILEQMANSRPQFIDLHGYRQQQIDDLFDEIQNMIKTLFNKGSSKLQTVKVGNNVYCVVTALTGKGLHSKYNKSVLKPALQDWCRRNNTRYSQTEDSILIHIEVR